jgi:nucleotide-binding universal stress UspA family protein
MGLALSLVSLPTSKAAAEVEMFRPSRILVPVDFTSSAAPAVAHAHDLAAAFGSRVHLLHVVSSPSSQSWASLVPDADLDRWADDWCRDATHQLTTFAARTGPLDGTLSGSERTKLAIRCSPDPADAILSFARLEGCDLIVMGTHRRSALSALLCGSTAERVRRNASCPVVLVPPTPGSAIGQRRQPRAFDVDHVEAVGA